MLHSTKARLVAGKVVLGGTTNRPLRAIHRSADCLSRRGSNRSSQWKNTPRAATARRCANGSGSVDTKPLVRHVLHDVPQSWKFIAQSAPCQAKRLGLVAANELQLEMAQLDVKNLLRGLRVGWFHGFIISVANSLGEYANTAMRCRRVARSARWTTSQRPFPKNSRIESRMASSSAISESTRFSVFSPNASRSARIKSPLP